MTPALDGIVVRKERAVPKADGTEEKSFVELTLIRVGVDPSLFRVPEGYRRGGCAGAVTRSAVPASFRRRLW